MTRNLHWAAPLTLLAALAASAALLCLGEPNHAAAVDALSNNTHSVTTTKPRPQETTMPTIIPTHRPLHLRLLAFIQESFGSSHSGLRGLDARMLTDIGIDSSEIDSIESEALTRAQLTRRRIVVEMQHG
ncbi:MAG: hypothetical protein V4792_15325 [Pseudomonadota bacterium]